jgi:uncharacterized protein
MDANGDLRSDRKRQIVSVIRDEAPGAPTLCARCLVASSIGRRMLGLLGHKELAPDEGLLLKPGNSIHTFFMRFPIDAVFLDRDARVLKVVPALRPGRIAGAARARAVLELPAGRAAAAGVQVGERLVIN